MIFQFKKQKLVKDSVGKALVARFYGKKLDKVLNKTLLNQKENFVMKHFATSI